MKIGIIGTGNMGQALGLGWAVGDFIRFQIIGMGLGPFATISLDVASAR